MNTFGKTADGLVAEPQVFLFGMLRTTLFLLQFCLGDFLASIGWLCYWDSPSCADGSFEKLILLEYGQPLIGNPVILMVGI